MILLQRNLHQITILLLFFVGFEHYNEITITIMLCVCVLFITRESKFHCLTFFMTIKL